MFLLQPFCELKHFRDCVFIPLIKGGTLPLVKGVNRISFGMDDAEEHWTGAALHGCGNCRGNTLQKLGRRGGLGPLPRPESW